MHQACGGTGDQGQFDQRHRPVLQRERIPQRDEVLANLPQVVLRQDLVPPDLALGRFVAEMTRRVINSTPVNFHNEARERIRQATEL
jgi:hypothetical protein